MIVYDTNGRSYSLRETNLSGGEGKLYAVDGINNLYAKIFKKEKCTKGRELKILEWERMYQQGMLKHEFCDQIVIPRKCLYSSLSRQNTSSFVGYMMEKQNDFLALDEVYTTQSYDYYQKVWVARNLCILTNLVHSMGKNYVIGDYNPDNVALFMSGSTAKLIDVDSVQMSACNKNGTEILLPTSVGVPEFLAPEIGRRLKAEKTDLENVYQSPSKPLFTRYTDYYALAYHIFYLLMNSAPYASGVNMEELAKHPSHTVSHVEINRLQAADKGEFVFARKILFRRPQKVAANYGILTSKLKNLFERAFIDGSKDPTCRPDAVEFYEALTEYMSKLEKRPCNHYMPSHYKGSCEWCRINHINN